MKQKLELLRRIFRCVYEILFSVLIYIFLAIVAFKTEPGIKAYVTISMIYIISYILREKIPNYLLLVGLHIVEGVVVCLIPFAVTEKILFCLYTGNCLFDAYLYAKRNGYLKSMSEAPWPTFLFSFIFYLFGLYIKNDMLVNVSYILPLILLVVYLVIHYLDGLRGYLEATKDVSGLPLKSIVVTNSAIVAFVIITIIVCMILGRVFGLERMLTVVGVFLREVLKVVIWSIIIFYRIIAHLITTGTFSQSTSPMPTELVTNDFINSSAESMELILKLGVMALVIYIIYKIAVKIIKSMLKKRRFDIDTVEEAFVSYEEKRANMSIFDRIKLKLSKEERARRYYKNKIERYKYDIKLNPNSTCRGIENEIKDSQLGDVKNITDLYADVRYGDVDVDKNILKKMSDMSKE